MGRWLDYIRHSPALSRPRDMTQSTLRWRSGRHRRDVISTSSNIFTKKVPSATSTHARPSCPPRPSHKGNNVLCPLNFGHPDRLHGYGNYLGHRPRTRARSHPFHPREHIATQRTHIVRVRSKLGFALSLAVRHHLTLVVHCRFASAGWHGDSRCCACTAIG